MGAATDNDLIYFHQDRVTQLPDGAALLAASPARTAVYRRRYGLYLQGHPGEAGYAAALLDAIEDKVEAQNSSRKDSLNSRQCGCCGGWAGAFRDRVGKKGRPRALFWG